MFQIVLKKSKKFVSASLPSSIQSESHFNGIQLFLVLLYFWCTLFGYLVSFDFINLVPSEWCQGSTQFWVICLNQYSIVPFSASYYLLFERRGTDTKTRTVKNSLFTLLTYNVIWSSFISGNLWLRCFGPLRFLCLDFGALEKGYSTLH